MPEFGGKRLASNFKGMIEQTLAKAAAESGRIVQEAADELASEMRTQAKGAARMIREEAAAVREAFGEYTGNNEVEPEKPAEPPAAPPAEAEQQQAEATDGKPNPIP